jgi:UDP-N-acetylmuramate--alanine ligase
MRATDIVERQDGVDFRANGVSVSLQVPGKHNVSNALAALAAAEAAGVPLTDAAAALAGFAGLRRRMDVVGSANGVTVIDDFGHNPDKIGATLDTLHAFPGRLLLMFQPHGYGPLRQMGDELVSTLIAKMADDDVLVMPDPAYFGGTVNRSVGTEKIIDGIRRGGRNAQHIADRAHCGDALVEMAQAGDRIVIMGARDDTLTQFATDILARIAVR